MENSRKFEDLLAAAYISGAAEAFKKSKELDSEAVTRNLEELKILRHRFLARAESAGYREPVHHIDAAKQMAKNLLVKIKEKAQESISTNANKTMHNTKEMETHMETPRIAEFEHAGAPAPASGILQAITGITNSIKAFTLGNAPSPSPSTSSMNHPMEHSLSLNTSSMNHPMEHSLSLTTNTSKPLPPVLQLGGKRYRLKKTYRKRK